jgi:hypothetical protein
MLFVFLYVPCALCGKSINNDYERKIEARIVLGGILRRL